MMERLPIETGRVVLSCQGRDTGRYFVVLQVLGEQYVMLVDGQSRKLDHPKKKKLKHVKAKPVLMENLAVLRENNTLQDATIRKFLKDNGLGLEQPLCKEDE